VGFNAFLYRMVGSFRNSKLHCVCLFVSVCLYVCVCLLEREREGRVPCCYKHCTVMSPHSNYFFSFLCHEALAYEKSIEDSALQLLPSLLCHCQNCRQSLSPLLWLAPIWWIKCYYIKQTLGGALALVASFDINKVETIRAIAHCLLWTFHKLKLRAEEMKKNNWKLTPWLKCYGCVSSFITMTFQFFCRLNNIYF